MRHIISLLMENESGALSRVSGLFSARGYNIESLTVAPTEDPSLSRMTIVTTGSNEVIEQIIKQLNKLIDVVKVLDLNDGKHIERELMLVKVKASHQYREEMKRISDIFRGRIIDVSDNTFTIEITGSSTKLDAYIESLDKSAIVETVRTGASGIGRRIDIRFVEHSSLGAAMLYFTGSGKFNKIMRYHANTRGFTLNEYGLYTYVNGIKGDSPIPAKTEQDIFKILGFVYLKPTEREF